MDDGPTESSLEHLNPLKLPAIFRETLQEAQKIGWTPRTTILHNSSVSMFFQIRW
jgi:hypothetical protein